MLFSAVYKSINQIYYKLSDGVEYGTGDLYCELIQKMIIVVCKHFLHLMRSLMVAKDYCSGNFMQKNCFKDFCQNMFPMQQQQNYNIKMKIMKSSKELFL